jgi:hypothetical protein
VQPDTELRFTDILTTAAAVANYTGAPDVTATHMLDAIAILLGEKSMEDLGRGVSPLVPRGMPGQRESVDPAIRTLAQIWFATLNNDVTATLTEPQIQQLRRELLSMRSENPASPLPPQWERGRG